MDARSAYHTGGSSTHPTPKGHEDVPSEERGANTVCHSRRAKNVRINKNGISKGSADQTRRALTLKAVERASGKCSLHSTYKS